jgi:uncharacterized protein (DUF302 family)
MLVKVFTDKSVSNAAAALHAAVQANHFGVMQVHNLKGTMVKKGVEFERECLIFEVCQRQQAKKALDQNMSVSTALPCRISIYEESGKAVLATVKPTTLLAMFNTLQLEGVAREVEDTIFKIMKGHWLMAQVMQTPSRPHNAHSPTHSAVDKARIRPACGRLLTKRAQQDGVGLGCLL